MATLTLLEIRRLGVAGMRADVLATLVAHMERAERATGKTIYVREYGGHRSREVQAQLYDAKLADAARGIDYPTAPPGESHHETGDAYDLGIVNGTAANYAVLAAIGRELGMSAGADYGDPFHFQSRDSLATARAKYDAMIRGRQLVGLALAGAALLAVA